MSENEIFYCPEIDAEVLLEGENVILSKDIFDKLITKISSHCDLKEEVSCLRAHCFEKFGKRGDPVSDPAQFNPITTGGGAQSARGADYLMQCCQFERYRAETW